MKPDVRKRDVHLLNDEGMLLCNPRDKEAAHRAAVGDILVAETRAEATCKKCLEDDRGDYPKKGLRIRP